ncbi:hypothetical protein ACA910_015756 [Epithemia clementina (nom. ined.)]
MQALELTGYSDVLNNWQDNPNTMLTIFAPTNAAFGPNLPLEEVPIDLLTIILLLHVLPNTALSSQALVADDFYGSAVPILNGNGATLAISLVEELDGQRLMRVAGPGNSNGGAASVVVDNVLGLNVILHVIDTVLAVKNQKDKRMEQLILMSKTNKQTNERTNKRMNE